MTSSTLRFKTPRPHPLDGETVESWTVGSAKEDELDCPGWLVEDFSFCQKVKEKWQSQFYPTLLTKILI